MLNIFNITLLNIIGKQGSARHLFLRPSGSRIKSDYNIKHFCSFFYCKVEK